MSTPDAIDDLERSIEFLRTRGTNEIEHSGRTLLDHLIGTRQQLVEWGARPTLCNSGLFHSVYGTEHFEAQPVPLSMRTEVRELIGEEAEHLAWLFCFMRRETFNENLARQRGFRVQDRIDGNWHLLTHDEFRDLANLTVANALEALPHLIWYERQRLRWACKRYLSLFRDIVLPAAREAVNAACLPWWNVWA